MNKHRGNADETHFLNVDLDIYSKTDLQPLVSALGKKVIVLYVGRYRRTYSARLEVARLTKDVDSTIRAFCKVIESLPRTQRRRWNTATRREFNIGVQGGMQPRSHEILLAAATVKAVSEVDARIGFTVYAPTVSAVWS